MQEGFTEKWKRINTEQWNAEERSSATGIGPLTAEIQGRRAVLGAITRGSRVPAALQRTF